MPNKDKPKLVLAMDVDYPPWTGIGSMPDKDLAGFTPEFIRAMNKHSDTIEIVPTQTKWSNCWN